MHKKLLFDDTMTFFLGSLYESSSCFNKTQQFADFVKNIAKQIIERKLTKDVDYRDQENLSFKRVYIVTQIIVDMRQIFCKTFWVVVYVR